MDKPILDSRCEPPAAHFVLGSSGPTGEIKDGRRRSESFVPVPSGRRSGRDANEQQDVDFEDVTEERREVNTRLMWSRFSLHGSSRKAGESAGKSTGPTLSPSGGANGLTSEPGLDVDTLYSQLVRRMAPRAETQYATVVPEALVPVAECVPFFIHRLLAVAIYGDSTNGEVVHHGC